jgi:hypothetical protein
MLQKTSSKSLLTISNRQSQTKKNHLAVVFFCSNKNYLAASEAAGAAAGAAGAAASAAAGAAAGAASSFLPQAARAAAAITAAKTRDLFIFKKLSELTKQFPEIAWVVNHPNPDKKRSISFRQSNKLYNL